MKKVLIIIAYIMSSIVILLTVGAMFFYVKSRPLFDHIPAYKVFVNPRTVWKVDTTIAEYKKIIGSSENDSMIVLTPDYMLLVTGQYCQAEDTVFLPCDGYLGIDCEVLVNARHDFTDRDIVIGQSRFVRNPKAVFQWWKESLPQIHGLGKCNVIVSGP